jgi:hypothetical protein
MKNFTLCALVALVFGLFARESAAQMTYTSAPNWEVDEVARYGPYWLFKPMAYNFSTSVIRQVSYSTDFPFEDWQPYQHPPLSAYPEYIPVSQQANAGQYAEDVLSGQGIDSLFFGPWGDVPQGWSVRVQILNMSYQLLATYIVFENRYTSMMPTYSITDPVIAEGATIAFYINLNHYNPGNANVTRVVKARVTRTDGAYDVTQQWVNPAGVAPLYASFSLPFNWQGEYCIEVWYEVYHNGTMPSYWDGPLVLWRYEPPCFYHGINTGLGGNESFELSAFPNPFIDQLVVTVDNATDYQLFGARGELTQAGRLMLGENRLSLPGVPPGVYTLRTEDGQVVRLVKE